LVPGLPVHIDPGMQSEEVIQNPAYRHIVLLVEIVGESEVTMVGNDGCEEDTGSVEEGILEAKNGFGDGAIVGIIERIDLILGTDV
jgi:hypothetical protein